MVLGGEVLRGNFRFAPLGGESQKPGKGPEEQDQAQSPGESRAEARTRLAVARHPNQVGEEREEESPPHDPEMRAARRVDEVGEQAARLGGKAEVERQVEQEGRGDERDAEQERVFEAGPTPAVVADADEDVRADDQRGGDEDVPGVEEGQAAEDERGEEEVARRGVDTCPGGQCQGTEFEEVNDAAPAVEENVERHAEAEHVEGQRQHVRMQVAEDKGEGGEFVYDFIKIADQVEVRDDAGGAPPPPEAVGNPATARGGDIDLLDVEPGPEISNW